MLEAHRIGMEKRLRSEFMTPAITVRQGAIVSTAIQFLRQIIKDESKSHSGAGGGGGEGQQPAPGMPGYRGGVSRMASGFCFASVDDEATALPPPPPAALTPIKRRPSSLAIPPHGLQSTGELAVAEAEDTVAAVEAYEVYAKALEAKERLRWHPSDRRLAYEDFDLRRWEQFEPYRPGELFFTPQERQRLISSILSARPAVGGAGIDTAMLLAGRAWRVPLPPSEEAHEQLVEAASLGWDKPVPLTDMPHETPPAAEEPDDDPSSTSAITTPQGTSSMAGAFKKLLKRNTTKGNKRALVYEHMFCCHSSRARFVLSGACVCRSRVVLLSLALALLA